MVVTIVVEAVEQEAGATSAGFENQEGFEGFRGRFQALFAV